MPGTLELEFITPAAANNFRSNHAFQTAFVSRLFNCQFHPQPPHPQIYFFNGLKPNYQRAVFDLAEKIAPCHLVTAYANEKLSPSGKLVLFRKGPLSDGQFKQLANQLKTVGIKLNPM
jgi:hypothetical protein